MTYLLDTNTCVCILRRGPDDPVSRRLVTCEPGDVAICSIVAAELLYGALRASDPARALPAVRGFCAGFRELPFDGSCTEHYAGIRRHLASHGTPIGPNDLLIAAIALSNGLTLVTHNVDEFRRVPGLVIEDWEGP